MITIVSVQKLARSTVKIADLRVGEPFIRGYHELEALTHGAENYSIYIKMPKSVRAVGELLDSIPFKSGCHTGEQKGMQALREGRIAYNINKCCCSVIDENEALYRVALEVNASVLV